jgi:asparagine synthase (glutamine-hydrolysing)
VSAISAVWVRDNGFDVSSLQDPILEALLPYGSHRSFSWSAKSVFLGGCLSNFLPEDEFDRQPLWSSDRTFCLVADVRLDNRQDLVRLLGLVHPEEMSDSFILMAAWERWGKSCLDHIIGGFAFAIWNASHQELFAARDHSGERPLFYYRDERFFALASMPKGLLALSGVPAILDEGRLASWSAGVNLDRKTSFFLGIERIPAGHFVCVTSGHFECKQYWHPAEAKQVRYARNEDYAEAFLTIFQQATECRLRTTKQVGSTLSAGLDSSSVTAMAAKLLNARGRRLTAFTAIPRPEYKEIDTPWSIASEGSAASEVAHFYPNIDHVLVDSSGYDLVQTMKAWMDAMDEPVANVVNLMWATEIFRQARERGINVVLTGALGNVAFSWEPSSILRQFFLHGQWLKLLKTAHSYRSRGRMSVRTALRISLGRHMPSWLDRKLFPAATSDDVELLIAHPEIIRKYDLRSRRLKYASQTFDEAILEQSSFFESSDSGVVNAAIQAVTQIESRDPTADKRIFDFCFSIPQEQYVIGGQSRSLARRSMSKILPQSTFSRYKRGYQGADWYLSMEDSLPSLRKEISLAEQSSLASEIVDLPRVRGLLDAWPESGYETDGVFSLWEYALTRGISMGYFLRSHNFSATKSYFR